MSQEALPSRFLGQVPQGLQDELRQAFEQLVTNYRSRHWESSALNGGKLCEVVYSILDGYVSGTFPSKAHKPKNMVDACNDLAKAPGSFPRSVRIGIPRVLIALYEIRNNRSVGHVGGDVDPNPMDALVVVGMAKWVVAELVRIFHQVPVGEASALVDALSSRELPTIWEAGNTRRVLLADIGAKDETLLLLFGATLPVPTSHLLAWTEYTNPSRYRSTILKDMHRRRLIEYDTSQDTAVITPLGAAHVESTLLGNTNTQ